MPRVQIHRMKKNTERAGGTSCLQEEALQRELLQEALHEDARHRRRQSQFFQKWILFKSEQKANNDNK